VRGGRHRLGPREIAIVAVALAGLLAPPASATITIRDADTAAVLEEFQTAKCKLRSKPFGFVAFSLPANDPYRASVFIYKDAWKGFGRTYNLLYGDTLTSVDVYGPTELYGNEFGPPGTPPGTLAAGGLKFPQNGKRFSVGAYGLGNEAFTSGVSVTGSAKCKYKRGHAPKSLTAAR
jgi:hypothetical protein